MASMTEDALLRAFIVGGVIGVIGVFKPQIAAWLHRIGYRDWREK